IPSSAAMTTLKFVPQIDLAFLDPHWSTANVTRGHGYTVFDTLYGQDGTYTPSAGTATKRRRGQAGASVRSWRRCATRGSTHPIPIRNGKSVSTCSFSVWSMYR